MVSAQTFAPARSIEHTAQVRISLSVVLLLAGCGVASKPDAGHEKGSTISSDEDANSERPSFDGERFFWRSPGTGSELAEAHNLLRMRSYQERVTRHLKSRTPILPVSLVPTLEETIFEESNTK